EMTERSMKRNLASRRRFLSVIGTTAVGAALPSARAAQRPAAVVWKGTALGALASITLVHEDRAHARAAIDGCVAEVERLERVFSLYRPESSLSRLNAAHV